MEKICFSLERKCKGVMDNENGDGTDENEED